jgi:peptide chain release factor 1
MFERLDQIEIRYEELTQSALLSPDITNDSAKYQKTAKAHSEVAGIVEKYREYKDLKRGIAESKAVLADEKDPEMRAYARRGTGASSKRASAPSKKTSRFCCCPKTRTTRRTWSSKSAPARAATKPRCSWRKSSACTTATPRRRSWKVEVLSTSESGVGGLKEVIALIEGDRVYSRLKYESGVHRVQRVPATEQQGACIPRRSPSPCCRKPKKSTSRSKPKTCASIRSVRRARRPVGEHDLFGGAHHAHSHQHGGELPGREVADQEPRKRHARAALAPLRSRDAEAAGRAGQRTQADGRVGRPLEKIRTYNFPQNRLTDHRIGFTIHQLEQVMDGKLQPIIDALITHYQAEKMKGDNEAGAVSVA